MLLRQRTVIVPVLTYIQLNPLLISIC